MPRSVSAAAMARSVVAPLACSDLMVGASLAACAAARALRTSTEAARAFAVRSRPLVVARRRFCVAHGRLLAANVTWQAWRSTRRQKMA
jgi:hypothetical protein